MTAMDQLLAIRAFARIVETGSFTKAAASLELPKAAVTRLVQGLERHLQVKLLQRTTRRLSITIEGRTYYESSAKLVRDLERLDTSFVATSARPRGFLRIDMSNSIAASIIIPALPDFTGRYPDIKIDISINDRAVDLIRDNVDCAIRGGVLSGNSTIRRKIGIASWVTCATPDYFKHRVRPRHPAEIGKEHVVASYLSPRSGRPMPLKFIKGGQRLEVIGARVVGANDASAHLALGLAGLGIIQTQLPLAARFIKSGELVSLLQDWQPAPYPFYAVYPSSRYVSDRLRVFVDWLAEQFRRHRELSLLDGVT